MNDKRYNVKGINQNNGMGDRSVVMCVVTPSMRLEGTAARQIQRNRRNGVTSPDTFSMEGDSPPLGPDLLEGLGNPFLIAPLLAASAAEGGVAVTAGLLGLTAGIN